MRKQRDEAPDITLPAFRPAQIAKTAPCQAGCLVGGDPRGWIGTVAQREKLGLDEATADAQAQSLWSHFTRAQTGSPRRERSGRGPEPR